MVNFIPEAPQATVLKLPYFEDSREAGIEGRGTEKSLTALQNEIGGFIAQLGGSLVTWVPGKLDTQPKRYGYRINFNLGGISGRIDVAALPIRSETPNKKDRALAQALYFLRDWLGVEVRSAMFRPGSISLAPFLIGSSGLTVIEALVETHQLPMLGNGR